MSTCCEPRCLRIATAPGAPCQHHLMAGRRRRGLCANCGGTRTSIPVVNSLTGRQLRRGGEPVYQYRCDSCGREQRPRT